MPTIIDERTSADQTVRILDNFYSFQVNISADEFDIVYGYFRNVCETKLLASNFTALLFRIAQTTGISALQLLETIRGTENKLQMNKTICFYLNSFRSKTSLYGISLIPRPNQAVARNVVQ
jgi:hypothetical protein